MYTRCPVKYRGLLKLLPRKSCFNIRTYLVMLCSLCWPQYYHPIFPLSLIMTLLSPQTNCSQRFQKKRFQKKRLKRYAMLNDSISTRLGHADNFSIRIRCAWTALIVKRRKNCECCPVPLLIVRSQRLSEFRFSIVRIVISVSNVTILQDCLWNCQNGKL